MMLPTTIFVVKTKPSRTIFNISEKSNQLRMISLGWIFDQYYYVFSPIRILVILSY